VARAYEIAPYLSKIEKIGKYVLIFLATVFFIYISKDKMMELNRRMNAKNSEDGADDRWEDESESGYWVFDLVSNLVSDNFSWYSFNEMSFYLGLSAFSLIGFAVLSHYNIKHDEALQEVLNENENEIKLNLQKCDNPNYNKKND
jgi:hypothetical protein